MFACVRLIPRARHAEGRRLPAREDEKKAIIVLAREFSPRIEPLAPEGVLIEVGGLARLFGDARAIAATLRSSASERGLAVRVAVAGTRTAACLLVQARRGVTVVAAGREAETLAPLPLEILGQAPGVGLQAPGTGELLRTIRRWGLKTLGDLAALPPDELHARLGTPGVRLRQMARGEEIRPLVSAPEVEPFEGSLQLDWPIDGLEPLAFVLTRIFEPLCARLDRADAGATAVETRLRLVTRDVVVRRIDLPAPMRDLRVLRTLVLLDLESRPIGAPHAAGIDEVTIALDVAPGRVTQFSLFDPALPSFEQCSTLIARLRALMGDTRVGVAALVDSHRPGAFAMAELVPRNRDASQNSRAGHPGWRRCSSLKYAHAQYSRSSRLASRAPRSGPYATHHDSGALATGRESSGVFRPARACVPVLRRFRLPVAARVVLEGGRPVRVTTDRPGLRGGRVERCAGPWRTSGAWWSQPAVRDQEPAACRLWVHDEWDVALGDGGVYRLCRDRLHGGWVVEGVVD